MAVRSVHWHEGMFLRPHHFQAAGRHAQHLDRRAGAWDVHHNWGLREVTLDSLWQPGNATHGFMDFMLMMGVVGDNVRADYVDTLDLFHTMEAYFTWYPQ